jgi:spermidine synthase
MRPWEELARATAPDGTVLELRRRGHELLIRAGGRDLMSSEDDRSSRELARLGCAHIDPHRAGRVLVGGLGMGFTLRAALDATGPHTIVQVAELVDAVAQWNHTWLAALADRPLDDPRSDLRIEDVRDAIRAAPAAFDAILLDVDNGPDALAHDHNEALYAARGLAEIRAALRPGGVLAVWSFSDDPGFTARLRRAGFRAEAHRVTASRKGRGRFHVVFVARAP